jgi:hypothetical protein
MTEGDTPTRRATSPIFKYGVEFVVFMLYGQTGD